MLTVVTVTLDAMQHLPHTLASIADQDGEFRWLVWDGGSTDGTLDALRNASERRQLDIIEGEDEGIFDAMNKSLMFLDDDDSVIFLNAGDAFLGSRASLQFSSVMEDPSVAWAYAGYRVVEIDGSPRETPKSHPYSLEDHAYGRIRVCHQATATRVKVLRQIGGFPLRFPVSSDLFVALELGKRFPPVEIPEVLVEYRAGGFSERSLWRNVVEQRRIRRAVFGGGLGFLLKDNVYDMRKFSRLSVGRSIDRLASKGLVRADWRRYRSNRVQDG